MIDNIALNISSYDHIVQPILLPFIALTVTLTADSINQLHADKSRTTMRVSYGMFFLLYKVILC